LSELAEGVQARLEFLQKVAGNLDLRCQWLLAFLTGLYPEKVTFNELHKKIKEKRRGFSKPTLSTHLAHLAEGGFVECLEDSKSHLHLKPRMYGASTKWVKMAEEFLYTMEQGVQDLLKATEKLNAQELTDFIHLVIGYNVWKLLKFAVEIEDERYCKYANQLVFSNLDMLMIAYRKKVFELKGKETALKSINHYLSHYPKS